MPLNHLKTSSYKLLYLGVLVVAIFLIQALGPQRSNAQLGSHCDSEVLAYCFAQNRPVDWNTCECNLNTCLNPTPGDCAEAGQYFDASTCTCVNNIAVIGICDTDPYALGCPRSFDTVFAGQLRILQGCGYPGAENDPACNPMIGGGSEDICSFQSFSWCAHNDGIWSSHGCACGGIVPNTAQTSCTDADGTWYNPGSSSGGGVCYNPSGIDEGSLCATSNETLASCAGSGGRWNPYKCTCN